MKKFSTAVTTLLGNGSIAYFFLVELAGTEYATTLPYNITMSNGVTYDSNSGLMGVEPPRASTNVDQASYSVKYADPTFSKKAYFESGAVGDTLVVRIGFINNTGSSMVGADAVLVQNGQPFLSMADTLIAYAGTVNKHGFEIGFTSEEVTAVIEGASPMGDLDMVRGFYTSRDFAKQFNATDSAYDRIYTGSGELATKWGKG